MAARYIFMTHILHPSLPFGGGMILARIREIVEREQQALSMARE